MKAKKKSSMNNETPIAIKDEEYGSMSAEEEVRIEEIP
jgi:hypothetical protein